MTSIETLRRVLWTMSQPRTVYILGSGASYGLIPFTPDLRKIVAAEFHAPGIYSVDRPLPTHLYRRVIGRICKPTNTSEALLCHISEPALNLFVQRALWRPLDDTAPPNYAIFNLVGAPAVLFNFNLDGMATFYCRNRHLVLQPHGSIDRERFESGIYTELRDEVMSYDVKLPQIRYKLLPSPEPSSITQSFAYHALSRLIEGAPGVLIIGYSFGRQPNGFDDSKSLEFFIELLRNTHKHAFVLSPSPEELTDILQQRISSFAVKGIRARWEIFARMLLSDSSLLLNRRRWYDDELAELRDRYIHAEDIALARS